MEWTTENPTEEGLYLRNNPPVGFISKQYVYEYYGELVTDSKSGGRRMKIKNICPAWLWYGPIPELTEEMQEEALKKRTKQNIDL